MEGFMFLTFVLDELCLSQLGDSSDLPLHPSPSFFLQALQRAAPVSSLWAMGWNKHKERQWFSSWENFNFVWANDRKDN